MVTPNGARAIAEQVGVRSFAFSGHAWAPVGTVKSPIPLGQSPWNHSLACGQGFILLSYTWKVLDHLRSGSCSWSGHRFRTLWCGRCWKGVGTGRQREAGLHLTGKPRPAWEAFLLPNGLHKRRKHALVPYVLRVVSFEKNLPVVSLAFLCWVLWPSALPSFVFLDNSFS